MSHIVEVHLESGERIDVDLGRRVLYRNCMLPTDFRTVSRLFAGSSSVKFYDAQGGVILATSKVASIVGNLPSEYPLGHDDTNVAFRTNNSIYEIDQEQKLFRRVAGNNRAAHPAFADGWKSYKRIHFLEVGKRAVIEWDDGQTMTTSTIREVSGQLIPDPPPTE